MNVTIKKQITFIFTSALYSLPSSESVSSVAEINSSTVHFRISATFLMFLTVGLTLFPHLQILPVDTFAFSSNLLIEIPRSFASLQIFS